MANPFRRGAKKYPQLSAHWDSRHEHWTFEKAFSEPAEPEAGHAFKAAVRTAFGLLKDSRDANIRGLTSSLQPPHHVWLNFMREEKRGFRHREQLRASLNLHAVLEAYTEHSIRPPANAILLLEDGDICDVFKQSASMWDDLMLATEGGSPEANQDGSAEPHGDESPLTDSGPAVDRATGDGANCGGVDWQAIEVLFLSDHRVQIHNGASSQTLNYGELGFADRRAKRGETPKPNRAWETLRDLAKQRGIIRDESETGEPWRKVEKRIQAIRRVFRKHFGIAADPIPYIKGTGYQARFRIFCSPSFTT